MMRTIGWMVLALAPWAAHAQTTAVGAATFEISRPVAPGSIAAVFGDFPVAQPQVAAELPLPNQLAGISVLVDGRPAGLYAVFPTQINLMTPLDTPTSPETEQIRIVIESEGAVIASTTLWMRDVSPALFTLDAADALRPAAVLNQDSSVNSAQNPARPGEILQIFGMGQGSKLIAPLPVNPPQTTEAPVVWFRTWPIEAAASVLPEGLPGMWQINAPVPDDAELPAGATPIMVAVDGIHSNSVTVWIEP